MFQEALANDLEDTLANLKILQPQTVLTTFK